MAIRRLIKETVKTAKLKKKIKSRKADSALVRKSVAGKKLNSIEGRRLAQITAENDAAHNKAVTKRRRSRKK